MSEIKRRRNAVVLGALASMGLTFGFAGRAMATTNLWFDNNGTGGGYGTSNNGSYSWDGNVWATTTGGTFSTAAWVQGSFAQFNPTVANYSVAVANNDEQMAGLINNSSGVNLTIKQATGTSGQLEIVGGVVQGFIISSGTSSVIVSAPMTGSGGIKQQGNGALSLFGSNSYLGGTIVTGGQVTNYNNNNSFGAGDISVQGYGQALVNASNTSVTIPNNVDFPTINYAINLAGGKSVGGLPGTIYTGNFNFPTTVGVINIETSNSATQSVEISGVVSGACGLIVSDNGTLFLTGSNTYTGGTSVASGELVISTGDNIGGSSSVLDINGGTLGINGTTITNLDSYQFSYEKGGFDVGDATNTVTINQGLGGTGNLTKAGAGTLILTGGNGYTGSTILTGGKLVLKGDGPSGPVLSGGTGADIRAGQLIFDYSNGGSDPTSQVQTALAAGYTQSPAFSSGPLHTTATADPSKGLGWVGNGTSQTVTVMYTYFGDTNLDGKVDTSDFMAMANNFGNAGVWATGDFNYDGMVNALDFNAIASNFGKAQLSGPALSPTLGALVPEPTSLSLLALGAATLAARRRR